MKIDVKLEKKDFRMLEKMQTLCLSMECNECPFHETMCGKFIYDWKVMEMKKKGGLK